MNKLEVVILDQYQRVKAAGSCPEEALAESQGEIMSVATPELTIDILEDSSRTSPAHENSSINAMLRAQMESSSILNRSIRGIRMAHSLARLDMLADRQGYTGGLLIDRGDVIVYGQSTLFRGLKEHDPIQEAMGETFYPPMMWVKALRAEAYRNRPESAQDLSITHYLAKLGLSLGSVLTEHGDIAGATGFMPGTRLQGECGTSAVRQHVQSEPIEAFRLSGLCDQAVLDPDILLRTPDFAAEVVEAAGSLN